MAVRMSANFAGEGLGYTLNGKMGPTLDSHRLIELARSQGGEGLQNKIVERLFLAYFTQGKDVSDRGVLVELASDVGVSGAEIFLASDDGKMEVVSAMRESQAMGVTGVPHFFFSYQANGMSEPMNFSLPGAQDVPVFEMVLKKLVTKSRDAKL